MKLFFKDLEKREQFKIQNIIPLHGGDINDVSLLETDKGDFVIKRNQKNKFPSMFQLEKEGLELLEETDTFVIPKVFRISEIGEFSYVLMEYIFQGRQTNDFWEKFAESLAKLHQTTQQYFGLPDDNYIGSLVQFNKQEKTAGDFYVNQRLKPQLKMARQNGFEFKNIEQTLSNIKKLIPNEPPSLIHGDLWSGNYLITSEGEPCLIDPAVAFASREMDLAMMKLFGGFPDIVFEVYDSFFPLESNHKDRIKLWQLYYLLVHLNLFGSGYFLGVKRILDGYQSS